MTFKYNTYKLKVNFLETMCQSYRAIIGYLGAEEETVLTVQ
jgi:hypothetical protein